MTKTTDTEKVSMGPDTLNVKGLVERSRKLLERIPPGPWTVHPHGGRAFFIHAAHMLAPRIATVSYSDGAHSFHEANARLIAAAPTHIAEQATALEQLQAENERRTVLLLQLRGWLSGYRANGGKYADEEIEAIDALLQPKEQQS